ncbi:MAG: M23 family metallopeptidase [Cyclobacteriaceae bacterium]
MRINKRSLVISSIGVFALLFLYLSYKNKPTKPVPPNESEVTVMDTIFKVPPKPVEMYGIEVDSLLVIKDKIKPNENISDILNQYKVSLSDIDALAKNAKEVFDVRKINAHKEYVVLCDKDSLAKHMIYVPNKIDYVVFNLTDSLDVYIGKKKVDTVNRILTGNINNIESSLYLSMVGGGASPLLVDQMADIFGWQVDFSRLQNGDIYKIIFEEKLVENEPAALGRILGAEFQHEGETIYAVQFDQGGNADYFDPKGNSLQKALLKYPVKFTRISSRYSGRRYHPVQKIYKAHLGTDYAAPTGTPIRAAGDGQVTAATYHRGNGRYVKIRHNSTYSTQYLHMSRIAKGIKPGVQVKQEQVIGYVGSTGLANGPHLCYRFWKNGKQVDPLRIDLPPAEPIKEEFKAIFEIRRDEILEQLEQLTVELPVL